MRIRPGTHVGVLDTGEVVIGSGGDGLRSSPLSPAQLDTVERLAKGIPLGIPAPGSVEVAQRAELLELLRPWTEEADPGRWLPGLAAERLRPDARAWAGAWGRAGEGARAGELIGTRTRARVWLSDLDRVGLSLAMLLVAAGVGRIAVPDCGVVTGEDLGTSPLRLTELGLPRPVGLARHVSRLYPHAHVLTPVPAEEAVRGADAVVMLARHGLTPERLEEAMDSAVPVLPLVFHARSFRLGPLLRPGHGCLDCVVENWEVLDPRQRVLGVSSPPELTLTTVAAGLAAQAVLALVDGVGPTAVDGCFLEGELNGRGIVRQPVAADCRHRMAA